MTVALRVAIMALEIRPVVVMLAQEATILALGVMVVALGGWQ